MHACKSQAADPGRCFYVEPDAGIFHFKPNLVAGAAEFHTESVGSAVLRCIEQRLVSNSTQVLAAHDLELLNVHRAEAWAAIHQFSNRVILPCRVVSMPENIPAEDVVLFVSKASLAVRDDLHPAIQDLRMDVIGGEGSSFEAAGAVRATRVRCQIGYMSGAQEAGTLLAGQSLKKLSVLLVINSG